MFRFISILSMCFFYIFISTTSYNSLTEVYNIISLIAFLSVVFTLSKSKMFLCLTLFFLGLIIHFVNGYRGIQLIEGITQNLPLLTVLLLVPLLTIPLNREGVISAISTYLSKQQNNNKDSYSWLSMLLIVLSPILNMGAIRVVHSIAKDVQMSPKLLSKAYFSGFTPTVVWSPFFASVGVVLYWLNMKYLSYVLIGVTFALIQITIGMLLLKLKTTSNKDNEQLLEVKDELYQEKFRYLIKFVIGLISLLLIMELFINKPMLLLVCFVCLTVPTIWIVVKKQWFIVYDEYKNYKNSLLTGSKMEISLFLSAGIFGNALSNSSLIKLIEVPLYWSANHSMLILSIFILLFVTFMAFLGVHQIIILPLIISLLNQSVIMLNPLPLAFICIFSWMFSAALSPLNVMNIVVSESVKTNGLKAGLQWNGIYFLVLLIAALLYVSIINLL